MRAAVSWKSVLGGLTELSENIEKPVYNEHNVLDHVGGGVRVGKRRVGRHCKRGMGVSCRRDKLSPYVTTVTRQATHIDVLEGDLWKCRVLECSFNAPARRSPGAKYLAVLCIAELFNWYTRRRFPPSLRLEA